MNNNVVLFISIESCRVLIFMYKKDTFKGLFQKKSRLRENFRREGEGDRPSPTAPEA